MRLEAVGNGGGYEERSNRDGIGMLPGAVARLGPSSLQVQPPFSHDHSPLLSGRVSGISASVPRHRPAAAALALYREQHRRGRTHLLPQCNSEARLPNSCWPSERSWERTLLHRSWFRLHQGGGSSRHDLLPVLRRAAVPLQLLWQRKSDLRTTRNLNARFPVRTPLFR